MPLFAHDVLRRALAAGLLLGGAVAAIPARAESITLYAAQHEQMVDMITAAFTKETGIEVRTRGGEAPELASQLLKEGDASPADVYFTENSPELMLLDEKGRLAKLDATTLQRVPETARAPSGNWVGVLARENVVAFNPKLVAETALPPSLMDFADPQWQGRIGVAVADADFLPLVGAVVALKGRPAALAWLKGLRENAQMFDDDEAVATAVERGAVAVGVINSYYWERMRAEAGKAGLQSRIHHFTNGDVGGLVNVSGAAVLASSRNAAAAQRFVAFLLKREVQEMLAATDVDFEYPLVAGVAANQAIRPFAQLSPPAVSLSQIGDDQDAAQLLREAGLI